MFKPYIAEFIGTFGLSFIVLLGISVNSPIPVPFLAALVMGLFVYTIGHLSGAHLNPAVTIGAWSLGKINWQKALLYIVAQMAGAAFTVMVARGFGLGQPTGVTDTLPVAFAEALGAFFFTFGIASVVFGRVADIMSGIVIGGSLMFGIVIAAILGSGGVLNPAVAFAVGAFNWAYVFGPIAGSIVGMQVFKYLSEKEYSAVLSNNDRIIVEEVVIVE
jgi:aquaporin Z